MKSKEFTISMSALRPSQLYISEQKLIKNSNWLTRGNQDYDPIPVIEIDGEIVMTDGHTRSVILCQLGVQDVRVVWENDDDDLDLDAYRICANWCKMEGIITPQDLVHRVIPLDEYLTAWIGRCQEMHQLLEEERAKSLASNICSEI